MKRFPCRSIIAFSNKITEVGVISLIFFIFGGCRFDSAGLSVIASDSIEISDKGLRSDASISVSDPLKTDESDGLDGPRILTTDFLSYHDQSLDARVPEDLKSMDGPSSAGESPIPLSCQEKYGAVPGFKLCEAYETSCKFYFNLPGSKEKDCNTVCQEYGGRCLSASDDSFFSKCFGVFGNCRTDFNDGICRCSL